MSGPPKPLSVGLTIPKYERHQPFTVGTLYSTRMESVLKVNLPEDMKR